jgi:hypothetical protein
MSTCRRLHLDQFTNLCDKPVAGWLAKQTGFRTERAIQVARLEVWIVETTDAYEPRELNARRTKLDALNEAERIMALPDSRGVLREWEVDERQPRGGSIPGPRY